jgi:predicted metal-dependent phosphoesterase TrpH
MTPPALLDHPMHYDAGAAQELRHIFAHLDVRSCPYTYNFHLHTQESDGRLAPLILAQQAVTLGLKGFTITDHHSVDGYKAARQWLGQQQTAAPASALPHLWAGIEISANLVGAEVHILGYGFDPDSLALLPYLLGYTPLGQDYAAEQVIAALHAAGGLAVLAHPCRYKRPAGVVIPAAAALGIDGVETFYCYGNPKVWQPSPEQTGIVSALAERYGLLSTCGTDTHGLNIQERL